MTGGSRCMHSERWWAGFTEQYFQSPMLLICSQFWKTAAVRKVTREQIVLFMRSPAIDHMIIFESGCCAETDQRPASDSRKEGLKDRTTASCFLGLGLRRIAFNNLIDIDSCFGGAMFTRSYLSSEVSFSMPRVGWDRITAGEERKQEERVGCIESEGFARWWSSSGARISCELQ